MLKQYLSRKESIIITVIEIIDDLGIQGLSTREIARREGISEGTLFKHFKNKNEMLLVMLDKFSQFDQGIIKSIALKNLEPKESIRYFLNAFIEYYENYPAITCILYAYDILRYDAEIGQKVKDIFDVRSNYLRDLIEEGKRSGKIQSNIDSESLVDIIIGFCRNVILKWRMNNYNFTLKERIFPTLNMILDTL